ncbi:MAG: hypothetical protein JOY61_03515, partial [Chloroflexi bacterium]|nr:hypothetical protein [Chloroflexota bacterium]
MTDVVRSILIFAIAAALCLVCGLSAFAQEAPADQPDQGDQSDQPADTSAQEPPSGPIIQPMNPTSVVCDPNTAGFRYLELRGSGFDAWAGQRLAGSTLDTNGNPLIQWNSIWVTPQGRLTLVVNICADPFRGRGALAPGTYTVAVGNGGQAIAATTFDLTEPQDNSVPGDQVQPRLPVQVTVTPAPSSTPPAMPLNNQPPTA